MKALFELSARSWSEQDSKQYLFKGLSLYAMDGTTLKTADTPEHREHFGAQVLLALAGDQGAVAPAHHDIVDGYQGAGRRGGGVYF